MDKNEIKKIVDVKTKLIMEATAELQEEVERELLVNDPSLEEAVGYIQHPGYDKNKSNKGGESVSEGI